MVKSGKPALSLLGLLVSLTMLVQSARSPNVGPSHAEASIAWQANQNLLILARCYPNRVRTRRNFTLVAISFIVMVIFTTTVVEIRVTLATVRVVEAHNKSSQARYHRTTNCRWEFSLDFFFSRSRIHLQAAIPLMLAVKPPQAQAHNQTA